MLRGHLMAEVAALQAVRRRVLGSGYDGVLLVPAFLEAGRLTAGDIRWARTSEGRSGCGHHPGACPRFRRASENATILRRASCADVGDRRRG